MKVKIEKTSESFKMPEKGKKGDLCYDVWAVSEEEIAPNIWCYGLGFKYEIERKTIRKSGVIGGYAPEYSEFDISIDLRPRSSIWKTGMSLANSEGTLDEFFRGNAKAVFYHLFPNMPRYKVGDKIAQIKLGFAIPMEFELVEKVNENTERGEGGFGSTGKK